MTDKNIMRDCQCLMITTKDRRKFFTYEKNYMQLLEFSKLFGAEVSVVSVKEAEVLDLAQLAPAFCDANYIPEKRPDYQVLEIKLPQRKKRKRQDILKMAQVIQGHITKSFLKGEVVSLKKLNKKFAEEKLTLACLCNHVAVAKKTLEMNGHRIIKVGGGQYQVAN
jgi:hypothetical protein